jgi:hypothetical protein
LLACLRSNDYSFLKYRNNFGVFFRFHSFELPIDESTKNFFSFIAELLCLSSAVLFGLDVSHYRFVRFDKYGEVQERAFKLFGSSNSPELQPISSREGSSQETFQELLLPSLRHLIQCRPQKFGWDTYLDFLLKLSTAIPAFSSLFQADPSLYSPLLHSFALPMIDDMVELYSQIEVNQTLEVNNSYAAFLTSLIIVFIGSPEHCQILLKKLIDRLNTPFCLEAMSATYNLTALLMDFKHRDSLNTRLVAILYEDMLQIKNLKKSAFAQVPESAHKKLLEDWTTFKSGTELLSKVAVKSYLFLTEAVDCFNSRT